MTKGKATNQHTERPVPHVVVIGGGFAGLYAARELKRAPVRVTVIDRRNHHLFQPMLYQVATAGLIPPTSRLPSARSCGTRRTPRWSWARRARSTPASGRSSSRTGPSSSTIT